MLRLLRVIFKAGPSIIYSYFKWILKMSRHPERYPFALRFYKTQKIVKKLVDIIGCEFDLSNYDELYNDDKSQLIICNHQSMFDPVMFIAHAKRPITFVAKIEIKKFPIVGRIVKILDGQFLDRSDLKQQVKVMMKVQKILKRGDCDVVIFPEGTRSKKPEQIKSFHPGSFRIPFKVDCDLAIMQLYGAYRPFQFLKYKHRYQLFVQHRFLKRYKKEDLEGLNSVSLCEEVYKLENETLPELAKKDRDYRVKLRIKKFKN